MTAVLEKLVAAGIQLLPLPAVVTHFVFERDGFICLVERREDGFGGIGAPGLLAPVGLAPLIWRNGIAFFVAKGFERPATDKEVDALRRFTRDLETALSA